MLPFLNQYFFYNYASAAYTAAFNPKGINTPIGNGASTYLANIKLIFNNGPRYLSGNPLA